MELLITVGGEPSIRGHNPFAPRLQRKGAVLMVSWSDIFQFVIVICTVAGLFYMLGKDKRK
ncbi:MAG TPA: hypothetical protein DCQ87_01350 [Lachnospiraceae bacterium]|nr:hypothetical protein [Lachnospiraceae bacterium]